MILTGCNELIGRPGGRFDGHAHVFGRDLPLAPNRRYTPSADAPFGTYLSLLRSAGLDGALLVQPSFLGVDNSALLEVLRGPASDSGLCFRGVVVLDPDDPAIGAATLAPLTAAGVVGLRLNMLGMRAEPARWQRLVRLADAQGWHIELHCHGADLPAWLAGLRPHCARLVIDHFGLPDPHAPLACAGLAEICRDRGRQLFVKASAPYRVFRDLGSEQAAQAVAPVFDRLVDCLGPQHLLWGSDWPWTMFEARHQFADTLRWYDQWRAAPHTD